MFNFEEALRLVEEENKKVTRRSWLCHHITKLIRPGCVLDGKIVYGSVINGYNLYTPSEEDKNATDWIVYNR